MEQFEKIVLQEKFFTKITAEDREKVKNWVAKQKGKTDEEKYFLERVAEAIQKVDYDYWIANLEPSVENGKIYYAENHDVGVDFSCYQWEQMAREYNPEMGSRLCKQHELFIWYALRIVNNLWTLDYVANDSSSAGNYCNAPKSSKALDKTGAKECGGYRDGQGNTRKIVAIGSNFAIAGGGCGYNGKKFPVALCGWFVFAHTLYEPLSCSSGVLVLFEKRNEEEFFTKITAEDREKVKNWVAKQSGKTDEEKEFLKRVKKAVQKVNYDYWIANLEPSVENGKIYYAKDQKVGVGFSSNQWNQMAKDYNPERGSRLCNLYELFIWYALRVVNKLWTLDYVANNSSSAGNYWNAPDSSKAMDKTGAKESGGYSDGQGNTYKIVTCEGGYAVVGGGYNDVGDYFPVADVDYYCDPHNVRSLSSGVLVLLK